jgi:hypothetical protein
MLDLHRWLAGGRWENEARVELGEAAMSGQFLEQRSSDEENYSLSPGNWYPQFFVEEVLYEDCLSSLRGLL